MDRRWLVYMTLPALVISYSPAKAETPAFTIALSQPHEGERECDLNFNSGVPTKSKVDALMVSALKMCSDVYPGIDVQVFSFSHGDALDDTHETYFYLFLHHKTGAIDRVTSDDFSRDIERQMKAGKRGTPK